MGGNKPVRADGGRALEDAVREAVADVFEGSVNVTVYENRGKLDVHVEPRGVARAIEDELDDVNAVQYSDLKLTINEDGG